MKSGIFTLMVCLALMLGINTRMLLAQPTIDDPFFEQVDYIGAFDDTDWTQGWVEWDPQNKSYGAVTDTIDAGDITSDVTLQAGKVYYLDGWVYVKDGATLTIEPGTVIRGSKENKGALIVEKGAMIMAEGTADHPIVFTSNQNPGSRSYGDWGGVIILGEALVNKVDPIIEGGPTSTYGGDDDADNSGVLKYVRIEFAGIAFQPDKEINGLTLGGVGSSTVIDNVQVSYSGDDSYEWFGGAVNCRHLIAFRGWDDDFDTDYGYRGMVQFAVSLRDPDIADPGSGSNGFESDNDATGTTDTPLTAPVFSNVSMFGPLVTPSTTVNANYKRAMHLRRNTSISIYNALFGGYLTGLFIDGTAAQDNASEGRLNVRNVFLAGCTNNYAATFDSAYLLNPENSILLLASNDDLQITDPFNLEVPDFLPSGGSPVLTASVWYEDIPSGVNDLDEKKVLASVYPNPFHESAILSFALETTSYVSVKLYDMTGTLIGTITRGQRTTGRHEFSLHIAQKGVIFAEIFINEKREILKIVSR